MTEKNTDNDQHVGDNQDDLKSVPDPFQLSSLPIPPHLDALPIPTNTEHPEYLPCPHLNDDVCELASWMANKTIQTTPRTCRGCCACERPRDVNEVTLALAGIEESNEGPGTTLHNLITWFIPQPENCGCPNRVALMNAWGKDRCLKEIPTILTWLRESALDNNYPYSEFVISAVLRAMLHAIR